MVAQHVESLHTMRIFNVSMLSQLLLPFAGRILDERNFLSFLLFVYDGFGSCWTVDKPGIGQDALFMLETRF